MGKTDTYVPLSEFEGGTCPACSDTMTMSHDNFRPTWSDEHDDVVCWSCERAAVTA